MSNQVFLSDLMLAYSALQQVFDHAKAGLKGEPLPPHVYMRVAEALGAMEGTLKALDQPIPIVRDRRQS